MNLDPPCHICGVGVGAGHACTSVKLETTSDIFEYGKMQAEIARLREENERLAKRLEAAKSVMRCHGVWFSHPIECQYCEKSRAIARGEGGR